MYHIHGYLLSEFFYMDHMYYIKPFNFTFFHKKNIYIRNHFKNNNKMTTLKFIGDVIILISYCIGLYTITSYLFNQIVNTVPYSWLFISIIYFYGSYLLYVTN